MDLTDAECIAAVLKGDPASFEPLVKKYSPRVFATAFTGPVVAYSGNAGSYTVDQTVAIHCSASDSASGIASTTCAEITGPAYAFAPGANTFSASATDNAGNTSSSSTTFTVVESETSLQALVARFCGDAAAASGLQAKLNSMATAPNANGARS